MRFSLYNWRKKVAYLKKTYFKDLQKVRGIVNTISFFIVWGYAGYFVARKVDQSPKETGIPHSVQIANITGNRYVYKWDLNTGEKERIDVQQVLAEKEVESRQKIFEARRLREENKTRQS